MGIGAFSRRSPGAGPDPTPLCGAGETLLSRPRHRLHRHGLRRGRAAQRGIAGRRNAGRGGSARIAGGRVAGLAGGPRAGLSAPRYQAGQPVPARERPSGHTDRFRRGAGRGRPSKQECDQPSHARLFATRAVHHPQRTLRDLDRYLRARRRAVSLRDRLSSGGSRRTSAGRSLAAGDRGGCRSLQHQLVAGDRSIAGGAAGAAVSHRGRDAGGARWVAGREQRRDGDRAAARSIQQGHVSAGTAPIQG